MIRLILFVVVGLLAGLGAGTGVAVLKAKSAFADESERRAKVVADSLAEHGAKVPAEGAGAKAEHEPVADSAPAAGPAVAADEAHADSGPESPAAPSVARAPASHDASRRAVPRTAVATVRPEVPSVLPDGEHDPAPARPPVTSAASKSEGDVQPRRIAKIFAAMPPKDAAKVLVQMDDADVHLILDALGEKQAAGILQHFPADRAAAISKRAIRGSRAP